MKPKFVSKWSKPKVKLADLQRGDTFRLDSGDHFFCGDRKDASCVFVTQLSGTLCGFITFMNGSLLVHSTQLEIREL